MTETRQRRKAQRGRADTAAAGARPVEPAPAAEGRRWPHAAAVFALVLALYAATAARSVCLEDDGLFILAARGLGLPQPPGYPLLVLLGKLFTLLPFGSLAYRGHLASAAFGAGTCAVLWLVLHQLFRDRLAAWAGALLLGVSGTFWSQAIICKTYTLNTLLFFLTFQLILEYRADPRPRTLYLLSATYGLSLANHWPLMGLSTPCLALALAPRWRDVLPRLHRAAGLALLCAAAPYAWMIWRSHQHPAINFFGPIRGPAEFWYFLTRKGFAAVDVSETAGPGDRLRYFGFLLAECGRQFTWVGAALAALGLGLSWRRLPRTLAVALLLGFLGSTVVLLLLLSFDYDVLQRSVFRVYPLVAYGAMAVWLVLGGRAVLARLRPPALRAAAWAALVAASLALHLPAGDRSRDRFARDYARTVLQSLEPNAVLFVTADMDAFPIAEEHLGEGVRPDVKLYSDEGILFDDPLFPLGTPADERQRRIGELIRATPRPVYFTDSEPVGFALEEGGLREKIHPELPPGRLLFALSPETLAFFERADQHPARDTWTRLRREQLRRRLVELLTSIRLHGPEVYAREGLAAWSRRYEGTAAGVLGELGTLVRPMTGLDVPAVLDLADRAEAALDPLAQKGDRAFPAWARGLALRDAGRLDEAAEAFRASLAIHPSHENPALLQLLDCLADARRGAEFEAVVQRHLAGRWWGPGIAARLEAMRAKLGR